VFDTHKAPICRNEEEFNGYLLSALYDALAMRLRKSGRDHRVVLSHCDLAPRNIIIDEDGKIAALVDWAEAGWYPEYWDMSSFISGMMRARTLGIMRLISFLSCILMSWLIISQCLNTSILRTRV
jgi:thiamine kinase-like enzyme